MVLIALSLSEGFSSSLVTISTSAFSASLLRRGAEYLPAAARAAVLPVSTAVPPAFAIFVSALVFAIIIPFACSRDNNIIHCFHSEIKHNKKRIAIFISFFNQKIKRSAVRLYV
nr:MAG TPA: hypothetical protein [Caudoviricetes sp.]DAU87588.1 MAG TPA: hypothetical protein [Caudoviricetes sp.]DAW42668.1 MAG TPA: hypothetical protein [Caudoviricetes sp.]